MHSQRIARYTPEYLLKVVECWAQARQLNLKPERIVRETQLTSAFDDITIL